MRDRVEMVRGEAIGKVESRKAKVEFPESRPAAGVRGDELMELISRSALTLRAARGSRCRFAPFGEGEFFWGWHGGFFIG